ncbi:MAG: hypothetical protein U0X76_08895 [Bacteroidia bacterium]
MLISLLLILLSANNSLNKPEIRVRFQSACTNETQLLSLLAELESQKSPEPVISAYIGALKATKARFCSLPWKKYSHCKAGLIHLNQAVNCDPGNIEIRYLRMLIEFNIPKVADLSGDLENDKKTILLHFDTERDLNLKKTIASFLVTNNLTTAEESKKLKDYL